MFVRTSSGSGGWRTITQGWIRTASGAGGWRQFFTSAVTPSIASPVTISTSSSSFPATLTGTNFNWTNATSLTYVFQKSSDNVNFTNIGSPQSISNPAVSNTVTYALTRADFPAFNSFFRFAVTGVNSTFGTSFTSTSASVAVNKGAPFNTVAPTISPTSGTAGVTTYSVTSNGTWDPDDSDGIYTYQWQSFDSPTYVSAPGSSTSSTYTPPSNFFTLGYFSPIRCRVRATNSVGSTDAFSNTATVSAPATAPSAPVITGVTRLSNTQVSITFTVSDGGSPITSLAFTSSPSISLSHSGTSSPVTVTGSFVRGTSYTFRMTATNAIGTSPLSAASSAVTPNPAVAPSAPQSLTRSPGNGLTKTFTWLAPADDGGSSIIRYEYSVDGGTSYTTTSSSTSQSFTYSFAGSNTFHVRAVNSVGNGTASSQSFTLANITSGPTASSITSSSATVSWTANSQSNYSLAIPGAPSTPYTGTTATSRSITGLSAATTYTPTLTITSSTSDTHAVTGASFTTGGGVVPPSGVTVTITSNTVSGFQFYPGVTLTANVSASGTTPFTFTYAWFRSATSNEFSTYSSVGTNSQTLATNSTYNNRWVRCTVTVTNSAGSASGTSINYFITDAV